MLWPPPAWPAAGRTWPRQHGASSGVNFWILQVFGYRFAPRYRDVYKKLDTLVGFKLPSQYGEGLIKPTRHVNETLIVREWPAVQRILASLAQQDVTQATVVCKLASYVRQNQTRKALWELEHLCRTLYLLDLVDDVHLRQSVYQALNRGKPIIAFGALVRLSTEGSSASKPKPSSRSGTNARA